jgi:hypothetical protein
MCHRCLSVPSYGARWQEIPSGAYREAAEKLRAGNRDAGFPAGSFPPALPFVGGWPSPPQGPESFRACGQTLRGRP